MALRKPRPVFHNRPLEWLQRSFRKTLERMLGMPKIACLIGGAALVAVIVLGMTVGREFLPELDEGALWLQVQLPTGLSLDKASEMAGELRRTLAGIPREYPTPSPSSAVPMTAPILGRLPTSKHPSA
jgi:heavy metal efflux system protein